MAGDQDGSYVYMMSDYWAMGAAMVLWEGDK